MASRANHLVVRASTFYPFALRRTRSSPAARCRRDSAAGQKATFEATSRICRAVGIDRGDGNPHRQSYGVVAGHAEVIATEPNRANRAVIFADYEGDQLADGTSAAGDRYALFPNFFGAQGLTANGGNLFDAILAASLN